MCMFVLLPNFLESHFQTKCLGERFYPAKLLASGVVMTIFA